MHDASPMPATPPPAALDRLLERIDGLVPGGGAGKILRELERRYRRAVRWNGFWVRAFQALAGIGLAVAWVRGDLAAHPVLAAVALALPVGLELHALLDLLGLPARRLARAPANQLGVHTPAELEEISADLAAAIQRTPPHLYVLRESGGGTCCVHVPALGLVPRANAIYLDPMDLESLSRAEIRSLISHEIGHMGPYPLHSIELASVPLLAVATFWASLGALELSSWLAALVVVGLPLFWRRMLSPLWLHVRREIELLCDVHAARSAGAIPMINTLLKLSARHEIEHVRVEEVTRVLATNTCASTAKLEAVARAALPSGFVPPQEARQRIRRALAPHMGDRSIFAEGFQGLRHARRLGFVRKLVREQHRRRQARSIRWLDFDTRASDHMLDPVECHAFLSTLHRESDAVLPIDLDHEELAATHPRVRRRVLLLGALLPATHAQAPGTSAPDSASPAPGR